MVRPVSDYVQAKYDDTKEIVESILSDGVESVNTDKATVDNKTVGGYATGQITDPNLPIGMWRTPNADRPTQIIASGKVATDGTDNGDLKIEVDFSGGTTRDIRIQLAYADGQLSNGIEDRESIEITIPPGASYQYNAVLDPNNSASVFTQREITL